MSNLILALNKAEVNMKEESNMFFAQNCGKTYFVSQMTNGSVKVEYLRCNKRKHCPICRAEYALSLKNRVLRAHDETGVMAIGLPAFELKPIFTALKKKYSLSFQHLRIPKEDGNILLFVPYGLDNGHGMILTCPDIEAFEWTKLVCHPKGTRITGDLGKIREHTATSGANVELNVGSMGVTGLTKEMMVSLYSECVRDVERVRILETQLFEDIVRDFQNRLTRNWDKITSRMSAEIVFTNRNAELTNTLVWTPRLEWLKHPPVQFRADNTDYMDVETIPF